MAGLVASNYSQALFELAKEENKLDVFRSDLLAINEVLANNEQLNVLMKHPKIAKKDKKDMIEKIFKDGDHYIINFMKLMIDKNHFAQFKETSKCYYALYNDFNHIEVAYVQSAKALNDQQVSEIKAMLEKKTNKNIEIKCKVNESLLAGIRIKIKDEILDNSAATRLERMKEKVVKSTL
ncbi:MAG: ATP synthase F1 subunit delta [Erysipelotrichia bacterium]|nr:ATP synthase F1 subunit delta [Erysipelotrichia bacterium]